MLFDHLTLPHIDSHRIYRAHYGYYDRNKKKIENQKRATAHVITIDTNII